MDLDIDEMEWNAPDARAALTNAPDYLAGYATSTHPDRAVASAASTWLLSVVTHAPTAHRGLVLHGPVGTGKTGLGVALLQTAAEMGYGDTFQWNMVTNPDVRSAVDRGEDVRELSPVWFERFSHVLALNRKKVWDEGGWFDQVAEHVALLMLDDVSVEAGTPFREATLLRAIDMAFDRHAPLRLVLTLNEPPDAWNSVLGERVADRLTDPRAFLVLELAGRSLRA